MNLLSLIKENARPAILVLLVAAAGIAYQRGLISGRSGAAVRERVQPFVYKVLSLYHEAVRLQRESVSGRLRKSPPGEKEDGGQGREDRPDPPAPRSVERADRASMRTLAVIDGKTYSAKPRAGGYSPVRTAAEYTRPAAGPGDVIYNGPRDSMRIALTFDAGNTGGNRDNFHRLVNFLHDARTPATFFLTGEFLEAHPDVAVKISRISIFEIGNHTYSHPNLAREKAAGVRSEIARVQDSLYELTGFRAGLFRPPYGEFNDSVVEVARSLGLTLVMWDVSPQDYQNIAGGLISRLVLDGARNGSIVLLHMRGDSTGTIEALPAIVDGLRNKGYVFVTVSALLRAGRAPARIIPVGDDDSEERAPVRYE